MLEEMLTKDDLTDLGEAAFEDGMDAHSGELSSLVRLLDLATPDDALVAVVGNDCAPEIVRLRALAHVASEWPRYSEPLAAQAEQDFDGAFGELLEAWRAHQDLRAAGACPKELFASRSALDRLRVHVAKLRRHYMLAAPDSI